MFPLTDARGRVVGFQARKLREDDPLRGKYVNSPETELFHKSHVLYGLHLARTAIAKQERAVVVEGNTDVIALRQAGFEPVAASMGTALTERQLKELQRLARRLYLCFDADAAGAEATLRGMDLAHGQFEEVRVVPLPPGEDPASAAEGFEARLGTAEPYPRYRVKLEIDRAKSKEDAFRRVRELVARFDQNTEWIDAVQYASGRLGLPEELQRRLPAMVTRPAGAVSRKVLAAGARLERDALAGSVAHPKLLGWLEELSPEHFDDELHRRLRAHLVAGAPAEPELLGLLAELDALAAAEGIDEETARELILRLRERQLRREMVGADLERTKELQEALAKIHAAVGGAA
jgi:DNA primase